jgi:hypothetical protein
MAFRGIVKLHNYNDLAKMGIVSYKHSMPAGDLLSLLPGLRQVYRASGNKALIYQRVNLTYGDMGGAYAGAAYSIKDEKDTPVTMNMAVFSALKPLLLHQDYIEDFVEWDGQKIDIDFDILRQWDTTMPYGSINRWPFYLWPDMACDLSEPWLSCVAVEQSESSGKILINRTERYNNMLVSYNFLKKYEDRVLFIGLPKEQEVFNAQHKLSILRLDCHDFLTIAIALKCCKLYIGNQSAIFQVAEGLKITRLLETLKQLPNVIGSGRGFYDYLHQNSLEYYVDKLFNE